MSDSDTRKIATLENEVEARTLALVLEERNIPHYIQSYHDIAYNGLFQMQKGWGVVHAPPEHESEILEILGDLRRDEAPAAD